MQPQRRSYSKSFKAQIIQECAQPGASIASVALSHSLNANLVHKWIRVHTHQLEALATQKQLSHRSTNLAAGLHLLPGRTGRVTTAGTSIAAQLPADGRRGSGDQAGNPTQAEPLGTADLNGGAFFNAEFGIRHRGSTVPERSGVALSFCGRPALSNHPGLKGRQTDLSQGAMSPLECCSWFRFIQTRPYVSDCKI